MHRTLPETIATAERLLDLARAFPPARLLLTATEFDLFSHVEAGADTPSSLAAATGLHAGAMEQVLNGLAAYGLLVKEEGRFANTPAGRRFLTRTSPENILARFAFQRLLWEQWSHLSEALRHGSVSSLPAVMDRPEPELRDFLMALHRFGETQAPRVVAAAKIEPAGKLLDLGGGIGTYVVEFCRRYPELRAVVFELPQVAPIAEEHLAREGLADRITVRSGDFLADPLLLPGEHAYDTLFLSNILHLLPAGTNRELLLRAAAALAPRGELLIHDVLMEEDGVRPVYGAMLSLTMLVMSEGGRTYPESEVREWLTEAGLLAIDRIQVEEDIALLVARRDGGEGGGERQ
jgi:hypothetical protein